MADTTLGGASHLHLTFPEAFTLAVSTTLLQLLLKFLILVLTGEFCCDYVTGFFKFTLTHTHTHTH